MNIIEWLKVILLGIVEGITEWLPISSTGHMILVDEFIKLNVTADFKNVFEVVIQLGAILAVVVIYFWDLWPFHGKSKAKSKSYFANPSDNKVFGMYSELCRQLLLSGQNYHVVQDRRIVSAGSRDRTGIQRLDRGPSDELRDRSTDADHLWCPLHHH